MSALIRSELLKLRTARSFAVMCGVGFGLVLLIAVASAIVNDYAPGEDTAGIDQVSIAGAILFFTLMLGTLLVTTEFRHGSIAATLLVEPDRRRLLAAKLIAAALAGGALALLTTAVCLAVAAVIFQGRDLSLGLDGGEVLKLVAGVTLSGALTGSLGAGAGAAIRVQTAAVVGIIVYLLLIEPILTSVLASSLEPYAIGNAMTELSGTGEVNGLEDPLGQVAGGLILLGWTVVFAAIGALVIQARDVTD